jgi:hypothetical protein
VAAVVVAVAVAVAVVFVVVDIVDIVAIVDGWNCILSFFMWSPDLVLRV